MEKGLEEEEALEEEGLDAEGHDVVVLEEGDLGEDPEEEGPEEEGPEEDSAVGGIEVDPEGEGLEEHHLEEGGLEEEGHGHEEGTELSCCVEAAAQSLLLVAARHDASSVGVALWASSAGAWVAHCEVGGVARALEGNAACVAAEGLEDAAVASDQAVRPADHRREAAGFQEGHQGEDLEDHLSGYLRETHALLISVTRLTGKIWIKTKIWTTDPLDPSGC